jgi:hypothetical protein
MKLVAHEAVVEHGQVKLPDSVRLPDQTRVIVLVPGPAEEAPLLHLLSPRLVRPECAADFQMEVAEEPRDAGL